MNRRDLVVAGLAAIPASLAAVPVFAAPKPGNGRARKQAGPKQAGRTPARKAAGPKFKVVTRSYASAAPITIPNGGPASPYPAAIAVGGLPNGTIQKVTLTLHGFSHSYPEDVDILLASPSGRGVVVLSDTGAATPVTGLTLVFDDLAPSGAPTPLTSGLFRPTNGSGDPFPVPAPTGGLLAEFNGGNPNGLWKLYVQDDLTDDAGSIAGWALRIRAWVKVAQQPRPKAQPRKRGQDNRVQRRSQRRRP